MAWFNERFIEVCIIIPLFFYFRTQFEKQFHAKTLFKCACYSVVVMAFVTYAIPSRRISILVSVYAPFFLTLISFYLAKYIENQKLLTKKLETMTYEEMRKRFVDISEYDLKVAFEYINRPKGINSDYVARKYNYSTRQVQRIIKKIREMA